jgi:hypothetical protein
MIEYLINITPHVLIVSVIAFYWTINHTIKLTKCYFSDNLVDLRAPFCISTNLIFLIFLILHYTTVLSGQTRLAGNSFLEITFSIILISNIISKLWGYSTFKIDKFRHYKSAVIMLLFYIDIFMQLMSLSYMEHTARDYEYIKILDINVNLITILVKSVCFSINVIVATFIYKFDKLAQRSVKTLFYDKLNYVICALLFTHAVLRNIYFDLFTYDIVKTFIRDPMLDLTIILCAIVLRRESLSVLTRSGSTNLKIIQYLRTFYNLRRLLKDGIKTGRYDNIEYLIRKGSDLNEVISNNLILANIITKKSRSIFNKYNKITFNFIVNINLVKTKYKCIADVTSSPTTLKYLLGMN